MLSKKNSMVTMVTDEFLENHIILQKSVATIGFIWFFWFQKCILLYIFAQVFLVMRSIWSHISLFRLGFTPTLKTIILSYHIVILFIYDSTFFFVVKMQGLTSTFIYLVFCHNARINIYFYLSYKTLKNGIITLMPVTTLSSFSQTLPFSWVHRLPWTHQLHAHLLLVQVAHL